MIARHANERGLTILRRLGACGTKEWTDTLGIVHKGHRVEAYRGKSAKQVYEEASYEDLVWLLKRISEEPGVVLPKAVWEELGYVPCLTANEIRRALPFRKLRKIIWGR